MGALILLGVAAGLIGFLVFMFWLYDNDFEATGYIGMNPVGIARLSDCSAKVVLNAFMAFRWDGDYRLTFENRGRTVRVSWYNKPLLSEIRLRDLVYLDQPEETISRERVFRHLSAIAPLLFKTHPEVTELTTAGQLKDLVGREVWQPATKMLTAQKLLPAPDAAKAAYEFAASHTRQESSAEKAQDRSDRSSQIGSHTHRVTAFRLRKSYLS